MKAILIKELRYFFNSITIYLTISIFLLISSLCLWVFPEPSPNIFNSGIANLYIFFNFFPWLIMLLAPIITMGIITEEKKTETIELLLTKPINEFEIIFGKFLSCFIIILVTLFPTIIYWLCIHYLSENGIDVGQIISGYLGLILISALFVSIGIFFSSITTKQLIAFLLSFISLLFLMQGIELIQKMEVLRQLELFSIIKRSESFNKGIIDLKDITFFISFTIMFLLLATEILKTRK